MAKERQGFVVYHSVREPLKELTDEQCGRLFRALIDYSERGVIPSLGEPEMRIAFAFVREKVDAGIAEWERARDQRSDAGKASAEKRKHLTLLNGVERR
ncbi:MAG: hypothetical protein IIZ83_05105 [Oscillospiraceae bacterium]|nr:hypothetical protein [Oscillospiraceae bacterium]